MLNNLGEILRIIRIANHYSIKYVSEITNLSSSYISDIERGRRKRCNTKTLEKFANAYSFSMSEIFALMEEYEKLKVTNKDKKYRITLLKVLEILDEKEKIT